MILVLSASACGEAAQPLPTETPLPPTATPTITLTPTSVNTSTPTLTSTPTETPLPTATFTPDVTPTQLPEVTPPVQGKGNVIGLVLWNDQPVPKALVWLCEEFDGGCKGRYQYSANTDKNGYYVFNNVTPGRYIVAINSFSSSWFIFYFDSKGNREQTVSEGENLALEPWNIWKTNLKLIAPKEGKILSDPHPIFKWEPFPDAAYYRIYIYKGYFVETIEDGTRVDGTEFTSKKEFITCWYMWKVVAFNERGTRIAEPTSSRSFQNVDLPTTCN
jgi:hypothetical protein